jgi:hypothetical protein
MFLPFRHKLLNLVWEYNGLFFLFLVLKRSFVNLTETRRFLYVF